MATLFACIVLFLTNGVAYHSVSASATGWSYAKGSSHGPAHWKIHYPDCGGVMQSPIDIDNQHVLYDPDLEYFELTNYRKTVGVGMTLTNVGGHTAEVIYSGTPILIRGGNLPDEYQVDQFHFHWGKENRRGSEHSVDEAHFPMEMHIVHHQVHLGNLTTAASHPHGLAVIGFFFQVVGQKNARLEPLLTRFDQIAKAGDQVNISSFALADLVMADEDLDFYRYMGSLTTPPCSETVVWSLATKPLNISEDQLNKFRNLYDAESKLLVDDFRPLQGRNSRTVTTTIESDEAGVDSLRVSYLSLTVSTFFSVILGFGFLIR